MAHIPNSMGLGDLDRILPQLVDNGLPDGGEFLLADLANDERTPALIALLIWHGFLPMAGMGMLLPKIHKARCIMAPGDVHVGKKVKRRARGFHLSVDKAWASVVQGIQKLTYTTHKGDCWLSDELSRAYQAVGDVRGQWRRGSASFHSVELWHTATGELVAGEIGYTCGGVYSSCTGFTRKEEYPGAGSVQLAALGRWLARCSFDVWDLGMELDYKLELGARNVPRSEWAKLVRKLRTCEAALACPSGDDADAALLLSGADAAALDAERSGKPGKPSSAAHAADASGAHSVDKESGKREGRSASAEEPEGEPKQRKAPRGGGGRTREQLARLTVRELKELLRQAGSDPSSYLEKDELVQAALTAEASAG